MTYADDTRHWCQFHLLPSCATSELRLRRFTREDMNVRLDEAGCNGLSLEPRCIDASDESCDSSDEDHDKRPKDLPATIISNNKSNHSHRKDVQTRNTPRKTRGREWKPMTPSGRQESASGTLRLRRQLNSKMISSYSYCRR